MFIDQKAFRYSWLPLGAECCCSEESQDSAPTERLNLYEPICYKHLVPTGPRRVTVVMPGRPRSHFNKSLTEKIVSISATVNKIRSPLT